MKRILFICKKNLGYDETLGESINTGLKLSVQFIVDMLNTNGKVAKVVEVNDNNDIDREVTKFKPTHVIIEALWVVPEKFIILKKLHSLVKWVVRIHSELPFLAIEGIAIKWIKEYLQLGIYVACNSLHIVESLEKLFCKKIYYLPNYFKTSLFVKHNHRLNPEVIHIGCFGAIRLLKNQLVQAIAAIQYANKKRYQLRFHINSTRVSKHDKSILKNIRALFENSRHLLIEHRWMERCAFIDLIKCMDLGMQVSFSETYNFVAADFVNENIPIVTSNQIPFIDKHYYAIPTNVNDIASKLEYAYRKRHSCRQKRNKKLLIKNSQLAKQEWLKIF